MDFLLKYTGDSVDPDFLQQSAPKTSFHLFEGAASTFNIQTKSALNLRPLSTALNLRHIKAAETNKISISPLSNNTLFCPTCAVLWIPGLNLTTRLVTHQTQQGREESPFEVTLNEHDLHHHTSHRLSKRARRRRLLKLQAKKEHLTDKLDNKLGLDIAYVSSRSKALQRKRKMLVYGCDACHVHHIITDEINNEYPTVPVKGVISKSNIASKKSSEYQNGSLKQALNHNTINKIATPETPNVGSQKLNAPTIKPSGAIRKEKPHKSKHKNSLQMLLAKKKESKEDQKSTTGLGLLGLMSKK